MSTTTQTVYLIVGNNPHAEQYHRQMAMRMIDAIAQWIEIHASKLNVTIEVKTCTDDWYLQHANEINHPSISIGSGQHNRLTDIYQQKGSDTLPKDEAIIRLDPEFVELRVALHGPTPELTSQAVEVFIQHHLTFYLRAVASQVFNDDE